MRNNKKGFSLVELLVVIAIIGILLLLSFPLVDNLIKKNNKSRYDAYRNVIEQAANKYMDDLGFIVSGCYEISYEDLSNEGLISGISDDCKKDTKVYVISDTKGNITDYQVNLVCKGKNVIDKEYTASSCKYEVVQYKDAFYSNIDSSVNSPKLNSKMIPVKYYKKGGDAHWVVADKNNLKTSSVFEEDNAWYLYKQGYFANAVFVKEDTYSKYMTAKGTHNIGTVVNEEDITSWWVWVPRFEYKDSSFNYITDTKEAKTEGYNIHAAFTATTKDANNKKLTGFWISKNTTTLSDDETGKEIIDYLDYGVNFNANASSHMIRNSEYEAAYLMNSSSSNETKINEFDIDQLVGSTFSEDKIPKENDTFSAAFEKGGASTDGCTNGLACLTCIKGSNDCCKTTCSPRNDVCHIDSGVTTTCQNVCETNECKDKCGLTSATRINTNSNINLSINRSLKNISTSYDWYKYLDTITKDASFFHINSTLLSCSSSEINKEYKVEVVSPWVFKKNNQVIVYNDAYTISINNNVTLSQTLSKYLTGKGVSEPAFNTNVKNTPLNISAKKTSPVLVTKSRMAMYY